MKTTTAILLSLLVLGVTKSAYADRVTEAKLRFEQGAELIQDYEVRKGLNELLISQRLAPNPNTLLNVARALDHLELHEYAYLVYEEYLGYPNISKTDRQQAEQASKKLAEKVVRLNIETNPPGVLIYLEEERFGDYGKTPREIAAAPKHGCYEVILKAEGYRTRRVAVSFESDQSCKVGKREQKTSQILKQKSLSVVLEPLRGTVQFSTQEWAKISAAPKVTVYDQTGRSLGLANEAISLPVGKQTLVLSADGFKSGELEIVVVGDNESNPADDDFDLNWDEETEAVFEDKIHADNFHEIQLEPLKGSVRMIANKIGALIYLNDEEVGFTPQVLEAAVGTHEVRLELTGYRSWMGEIDIEDAEQRSVGEIEFRRPSESMVHPAWPWSLAGLSAVSLGLSVGLAMEGREANQDLSPYPTEIEVDRGNRYLLMADGAATISVLSAVGSYFLFRTISQASHSLPRSRFYERGTVLEDLPPFLEMEDSEIVSD